MLCDQCGEFRTYRNNKKCDMCGDMLCEKCQYFEHELDKTYVFCYKCFKELEKGCPALGRFVKDESKPETDDEESKPIDPLGATF